MIDLKFLIEYEWKLFINHVSKYYPIPTSLLSKYKDVFNWRFLDSNKRIDWNRDLIERYKERFRWWIFTHESEFHWEVDDIKRFKGYLDINWLGWNKHFKVNAEILRKPPKKGFMVTGNNIYLTQELIDEFPDKIRPHSTSTEEEMYDEVEIKSKMRNLETSPSISLFKLYIEKELNDDLLESVLRQVTEDSQKYFYLSLNSELITNYSLPKYFDANPTFELDAFESEVDEFFDNQGKKVAIEGTISGGKKIIPELIELEASLGTIYLVSEHFRAVLDHFQNYKYYEFNISHKNLLADSVFSAVSLASRNIQRERVVEYGKAEFKVFKEKTYNIKSPFEPIDIEINSQKDFLEKRSSLDKQDLSLHFHSHPVSEPYDIFIKSINLVVSEFLKEALEQVFPNQFNFRLAKELNITIPKNEYLKKKAKYSNKNWKSLNIGCTTTKPDKE